MWVSRSDPERLSKKLSDSHRRDYPRVNNPPLFSAL
jgi:hypothetical protein